MEIDMVSPRGVMVTKGELTIHASKEELESMKLLIDAAIISRGVEGKFWDVGKESRDGNTISIFCNL